MRRRRIEWLVGGTDAPAPAPSPDYRSVVVVARDTDSGELLVSIGSVGFALTSVPWSRQVGDTMLAASHPYHYRSMEWRDVMLDMLGRRFVPLALHRRAARRCLRLCAGILRFVGARLLAARLARWTPFASLDAPDLALVADAIVAASEWSSVRALDIALLPFLASRAWRHRNVERVEHELVGAVG